MSLLFTDIIVVRSYGLSGLRCKLALSSPTHAPLGMGPSEVRVGVREELIDNRTLMTGRVEVIDARALHPELLTR